jgi:hypothetical protein
MAKYAKTGRFLKEDFPGAPSWMDNFLKQLNKFKDQVEQLLDKKLTISDNMAGGIYELELDTTGSVDNALPVSFKFTQGKPKVVFCGGCWDVTGEETPVSVQSPAWTYDQESISIIGLNGLSADRKYRVNFVVLVS